MRNAISFGIGVFIALLFLAAAGAWAHGPMMGGGGGGYMMGNGNRGGGHMMGGGGWTDYFSRMMPGWGRNQRPMTPGYRFRRYQDQDQGRGPAYRRNPGEGPRLVPRPRFNRPLPDYPETPSRP